LKKREQERAQQEAQEKAKQEQERRKRLDEQVQKKLDTEKQRADERQRQSEEKRRQLEEESEQKRQLARSSDVGFSEFAPARTEVDTIDLLGGLTDDEDEEVIPRDEPQLGKRAHQLPWDQKQEAREAQPQRSGVASSLHRGLPQRGNVDAIADQFFDNALISVPIKKTSKTDGVYLFGSRIMKLQLQDGGLVVAIAPKNKMALDAFIAKFEKVETLRAKGLQAAFNVCTMLGSKPVSVNPGQIIKA